MPNAANLNLLPSSACVSLIERSEGFSATAYWDNGSFAIGYGHHGPEVKEGLTWTLSQAQNALDDDLSVVCKEIDILVNVPLTQGQYDALCDWVYNEGSGRLKSSTLLRLLNNSQYAQAGQQLLVWDYANGKVDEGLEVRRESELALWNS